MFDYTDDRTGLLYSLMLMVRSNSSIVPGTEKRVTLIMTQLEALHAANDPIHFFPIQKLTLSAVWLSPKGKSLCQNWIHLSKLRI